MNRRGFFSKVGAAVAGAVVTESAPPKPTVVEVRLTGADFAEVIERQIRSGFVNRYEILSREKLDIEP